MSHTCRYCGLPIKKFLFGWIHVNDGFFGLPVTVHIAKPK